MQTNEQRFEGAKAATIEARRLVETMRGRKVQAEHAARDAEKRFTDVSALVELGEENPAARDKARADRDRARESIEAAEAAFAELERRLEIARADEEEAARDLAWERAGDLRDKRREVCRRVVDLLRDLDQTVEQLHRVSKELGDVSPYRETRTDDPTIEAFGGATLGGRINFALHAYAPMLFPGGGLSREVRHTYLQNGGFTAAEDGWSDAFGLRPGSVANKDAA